MQVELESDSQAEGHASIIEVAWGTNNIGAIIALVKIMRAWIWSERINNEFKASEWEKENDWVLTHQRHENNIYIDR